MVTADNNGAVAGLSISTFLQMLEHERKSCALEVRYRDLSGTIFVREGEVIDAECGDREGEDAVFAVFGWPEPIIRMAPPDPDRPVRIHSPLANILLRAAQYHDEHREEEPVPPPPPRRPPSKPRRTPAEETAEIIAGLDGVEAFYLLDRTGKALIQSRPSRQVCDFIAYCIVTGVQLRNALEVKGPSRIHLAMHSGKSLLILPNRGMIIAMQLTADVVPDEVSERLRQLLDRQGRDQA